MSDATDDSPAAQQIDDLITAQAGWRGERLSQLRLIITAADADAIEEVKWKKPSKPEGVPVWSHDGIICVADTLKNAVRLTFPQGAALRDPKQIFNTRLDSKTVRAVDYFEDTAVDDYGLKALIKEAAQVNMSKAALKRKSK